MSRLLSTIFEDNAGTPDLLTPEKIRNTMERYAFTVHRQSYQSMKEDYRRCSSHVTEQCTQIQRREREKQEKGGASDKPLTPPNLGELTWNELTYAQFATRLEAKNGERILDKATVDRELGKFLGRLPKHKNMPKFLGEQRTRLRGRESTAYWARRARHGK